MNLFGQSLRVGSLFNIGIYVHFTFLIYAVFRLISAGDGMAYEATWLGMLFFIVLCHELGHCFGAQSVGGRTVGIIMWPLGGLAVNDIPTRVWQHFITVLCGPLVNLLFCLISGGILAIASGKIDWLGLSPFGAIRTLPVNADWAWMLSIFYNVNYFLLAFNLLPVFPMDGGRLLQCALWPSMGYQGATRIAAQIGLGGAVVMGLFALRGGGGNMLLFIAIFGGFSSWQTYQLARYGQLHEDPYVPQTVRRNSGWWQRLTGAFKSKPKKPVTPPPNPNPGGWQAKLDREAEVNAEIDRILAKVHDQGIQSLSYTERQTLEKATRERQRQERDFNQKTGV